MWRYKSGNHRQRIIEEEEFKDIEKNKYIVDIGILFFTSDRTSEHSINHVSIFFKDGNDIDIEGLTFIIDYHGEYKHMIGYKNKFLMKHIIVEKDNIIKPKVIFESKGHYIRWKLKK